MNFKVGDIVKGTNIKYGVTNVDMYEGKVVGVVGGLTSILVLEHEYRSLIGRTFLCSEVVGSDFDVIKSAIIGGKKVRKVMVERDELVTFIIVGDITIAVPKNCSIGIAKKHPDDEMNEEMGKALAYYRMVN